MFTEPMYRSIEAQALMDEDLKYAEGKWNDRNAWAARAETENDPAILERYETRGDFMQPLNFRVCWRAACVAWGAIIYHRMIAHSPRGTRDPVTMELLPDAAAHEAWNGRPLVDSWTDLGVAMRVSLLAWVHDFYDRGPLAGEPDGDWACDKEPELFRAVVLVMAPSKSLPGRVRALVHGALGDEEGTLVSALPLS